MSAPRRRAVWALALLSAVKEWAIEKANSVPYGLAGYVERLSQGVEVGNLSINHFVASSAETPFGGVKDSGCGREGDRRRAVLYCGEERLAPDGVTRTQMSTGSPR